MFSNLNWYNVVVLLLLALFIFGDKLPRVINDGMRLLRNMRRMAQSATTDLSRELGTDIQLEDLHPKTFVRKHLLSEEDQEKLLKPLKGVSDDLVEQTRGVERELKDVSKRANRVAGDVRESAELTGAAGSRNSSSAKGAKSGKGARRSAASDAGSASAAPAAAAPASAAAESVPAPRTSFDDIT